MQNFVRVVQSRWLALLLLAVLILFPFIVGVLTDSSPFGVARGDRMIMRGGSVRWQSVLIEVYILAMLAMSYNLLFGFTGVISFGHALFFGTAGYVLGLMLEYTALDTGWALAIGVVAVLQMLLLPPVVFSIVSNRWRAVVNA